MWVRAPLPAVSGVALRCADPGASTPACASFLRRGRTDTADSLARSLTLPLLPRSRAGRPCPH